MLHQIWNNKRKGWPRQAQKWTFLNPIVCLLSPTLRWYRSQLLKNQVITMTWVMGKSAVAANSKDQHEEAEEET